eukprot:jgi/Mesen1/10401/ME000081S09790
MATLQLPALGLGLAAACHGQSPASRVGDICVARDSCAVVLNPPQMSIELRTKCQHGASTLRSRSHSSQRSSLQDVLHESVRLSSCRSRAFGSEARRGLVSSSGIDIGHIFKRQQEVFIAQAVEAPEEALHEDDAERLRQWGARSFSEGFMPAAPLPMVKPPKNRADDISLHNPLRRLERMGCGWLAVIFEWEGVIVEDDVKVERQAWAALAEEEGRPQPMAFVLHRAEGMKNEQAISEVFCWTRDYKQMKRLSLRKEELYEEMQGGCYRLRLGAKEFVETLKNYNVPIMVASTRPRKHLERAIEAVGMEGFFNDVLASEDVFRGKPDPEMFQYAAERLGFIAERCIVIGNSNKSIEAAHDALMKCVAVVGKHPGYELNAADLVVRRLDDLSFVDLKNLADLESPEFLPPDYAQLEAEPEEEIVLPSTGLAVMDRE